MTDETILARFGELPEDPEILAGLHLLPDEPLPLTDAEIAIGRALATEIE